MYVTGGLHRPPYQDEGLPHETKYRKIRKKTKANDKP